MAIYVGIGGLTKKLINKSISVGNITTRLQKQLVNIGGTTRTVYDISPKIWVSSDYESINGTKAILNSITDLRPVEGSSVVSEMIYLNGADFEAAGDSENDILIYTNITTKDKTQSSDVSITIGYNDGGLMVDGGEDTYIASIGGVYMSDDIKDVYVSTYNDPILSNSLVKMSYSDSDLDVHEDSITFTWSGVINGTLVIKITHDSVASIVKKIRKVYTDLDDDNIFYSVYGLSISNADTIPF
jgi:hypothetical protein